MAKRKSTTPTYPVTAKISGGAEIAGTLVIGFRSTTDGKHLILRVTDKKAGSKTPLAEIVLTGGKKGSHDFVGNVVRWLGNQ
jgi:hypothetical protein